MSISIQKTITMLPEELSIVQSTPILVQLKLSSEEGPPIILLEQQKRYRKKQRSIDEVVAVLEELPRHIQEYIRKNKKIPSLEETLQLIHEFLEEHKDIIEYIKEVIQDWLKNTIEIDSKIRVINKEKYIDFIINTYREADHVISAMILKMLKKKHKGKTIKLRRSVELLLSLSNLIAIALFCIELNADHPRILDIIGILNTVLSAVIIRDIIVFEMINEIDDTIIIQLLGEEKDLYEEINNVLLDPDSVLS